ncbi:MAG: hypothetical protein CVT89_08710, partial [Candidatus Altiarchaeales archaeon HGW-Altiarchaeales-2]
DTTNAQPGSTVKYTITVRNRGNAEISLNFTDILPTGFNYIDNSLQNAMFVSYTHPTLKFNATIKADQILFISYQVKVNSSANETSTNTIYVDGKDKNGNVIQTQQASETVFVGASHIIIDKDRNPNVGTIEIGSEVNYTITINNTGSVPIYALTIKDKIPSGLLILGVINYSDDTQVNNSLTGSCNNITN